MSSSVVKDRLAIARGKFVRDLETTIVKATKRNLKPPKRKHVNSLISTTYRRDLGMIETVRLLTHRLHDFSWNVSFKALIVVHHIMNAGHGDRFIHQIAPNYAMLNLAGFYDRSGQGVEQAKNVRAYARYLEERVCAYRARHIDFPKGVASSAAGRRVYRDGATESRKDFLAAIKNADAVLDLQDMLADLEAMSSQTDALLSAEYPLDEIDNGITYESFTLLIQDLLHLYHPMNDMVMTILQAFFGLEKDMKLKVLQAYKRFGALTERVRVYLERTRKLPSNLAVNMLMPELKAPPQRLAQALEDYLHEEDQAADIQTGVISPTERTNSHASSISKSGKSQISKISPSNSQTKKRHVPAPQEKTKNELIDFFASVDQDMPTTPMVQATFANNPFATLSSHSPGTPGGSHNPFSTNSSLSSSASNLSLNFLGNGTNGSGNINAKANATASTGLGTNNSFGDLSVLSMPATKSSPMASPSPYPYNSPQQFGAFSGQQHQQQPRPFQPSATPQNQWLFESPKLGPAPINTRPIASGMSGSAPGTPTNPFAAMTLERRIGPPPSQGMLPPPMSTASSPFAGNSPQIHSFTSQAATQQQPPKSDTMALFEGLNPFASNVPNGNSNPSFTPQPAGTMVLRNANQGSHIRSHSQGAQPSFTHAILSANQPGMMPNMPSNSPFALPPQPSNAGMNSSHLQPQRTMTAGENPFDFSPSYIAVPNKQNPFNTLPHNSAFGSSGTFSSPQQQPVNMFAAFEPRSAHPGQGTAAQNASAAMSPFAGLDKDFRTGALGI